jgi:hypothetical protein
MVELEKAEFVFSQFVRVRSVFNVDIVGTSKFLVSGLKERPSRSTCIFYPGLLLTVCSRSPGLLTKKIRWVIVASIGFT